MCPRGALYLGCICPSVEVDWLPWAFWYAWLTLFQLVGGTRSWHGWLHDQRNPDADPLADRIMSWVGWLQNLGGLGASIGFLVDKAGSHGAGNGVHGVPELVSAYWLVRLWPRRVPGLVSTGWLVRLASDMASCRVMRAPEIVLAHWCVELGPGRSGGYYRVLGWLGAARGLTVGTLQVGVTMTPTKIAWPGVSPIYWLASGRSWS